ncbi:MAG: hypothetical protein HZB57_04695, partial [Gammaproteobacteria bacterium]|nr:hypothetical protein [Gammaproteobacteria bacterium]
MTHSLPVRVSGYEEPKTVHVQQETGRHRRGVFAVMGLLMLAGLACAGHAGADARVSDAQGWQEADATPEGRLYHRPMPGSAIPQVLIATRFAAPAAAVYAVVTDYAHFADFIPDVAESRIIRVAGDVQWVFHRLHFAGPVADRVYVMRSVGRTIGVGAYRVEWALTPEPVPAGEQGIAPRQFSGFWELRTADDGKTTEARYAVQRDRGGRIPVWLVSGM